MSIASGTRLGPYEVLSLLGAGAMGEVYLAEDQRLGRKVALKVLPAEFTTDDHRLRRFEQEARAASALNHPNIVTILDIGEVNGVHFMTHEYVEGDLLRERLSQGRPSLGAALDFAIQVASALTTAHEAGIAHRDIKPENVMLRRDGIVKVLDFGLAKLTERPTPSEVDAEAATRAKVATDPGTVMGTPQYMSPEQARGQVVDARSDIFSLGVMLYEMIAGRSPFGGVNALEVIGEILKSEPQPLSQYATETPAELQRIVGKALRKNREERYQTARDLLNDLKDLKEELSFTAKRARAGQTGKNEAVTVPADAVPTAAGAAVQTTSSAKIILGEIKRHKLGVALMLALLLVVVGGLLWRGKEKAKVSPPLRVATFTQLTRQPGQELFPSLSPDGKLLVYASNESTRIAEAGNWNLYLQRVGGATPINLTSDSAADDTQPAFAPDGEQIVFRSSRDGGGLFIMGATGENVRRLTDHGYNPAWSADGKEVVYSTSSFAGPSQRGPLGLLYAVNVVTRETRQITKDDAVQPNCSPHGHRIAYWGVQRGGQRDIWTIPAGGGQPVPVTNDAAVDWNSVWSPDGNYLYFASDRGGSMNLWRVPIDERSGKLLGAPEPFTTPAAYSGYLSFSRDGHRLAYAQVSNQVNLQQLGFDPAQERVEGNPRWITRGARVATNPDLSADGQWIVFDTIGDKQEDLFVIRRDGTGLRQITNDQLKDRAPRWSPDGKRILFFSDRSGRYELWTIKADGSGLEQLTRTAGPGLQVSIWSPDGARIVCGRQGVPPMLLAADKPWAQQSPQSLPTEGYPPEFLPWSWSADGQKLAGYDDASIFSYSFASQRYERLADFGDRPVWLNDNRRVLFFSQDKLLLLDSQTRKVREILSVAPNRFQSLGLSRDGRVIYFSLQTIEADIWLASLE